MNPGQPSDLYADILRRLSGARRKEQRLAVYQGAMISFLGSAFLLGSVTVLEQVCSFGTIGRTILFSITLAGILGILGWYLVRPFLYIIRVFPSADDETIAKRVGQHFPAIRDRLLDALQIYTQRDQLDRYYSRALIDASFTDLYQNLRQLDLAEAISDAGVRKMRKVTLYAFGVFLMVFILSPSGFFGPLYRIVNFHQTFAAPIPIQFSIEPGDIKVVRGQDVPITIRTQGRNVKSISLATRVENQLEFDQQHLLPGNDGGFHTNIKNIKSTTDYFASVDDIKSNTFKISVLDRPLIRSLHCVIHAPSYTRIPVRTLDENIGDVEAYPGSMIEFHVVSSKELSLASLAFNDSASVPLTIHTTEASGSVVVRKNATYHIVLHDSNGLSNIDPVEYSIKILPDASPTVEIISPGKNIDLTDQMKIDLLIRAKDDFGFSSMHLAYRLANSRYEKPAETFTTIDIPIADKNQQQLDSRYHWNLDGLHLVPEDVVAYYVEVFDNDNVRGPKSGRSEIFLLRLPSLEEVFSDVNQQHDQSMESMQNIATEAQALKKEMEELQRDMKTNRDKAEWQQQKRAEELARRYDALQKKLEETAKQVDEMVNKMTENNLLSPKTMEKYQELQKLMSQLNTPEFREALKKLQESMKQTSPNQMQQAMDQAKLTEEQFRETLERTIELLKRIHIEQKIDELIKRADELTKQQQLLREQSAHADSADKNMRNDLAQQQSDLQQSMEQLEKETGALKDQMEEFPREMPLDEMRETEEKVMKNQTAKKMQSSVMNLQSGRMQSAGQNQQESERDLSEFKQQMEQVQKALQDLQMQQIAREMRRQLENMLSLSKQEESLKDESTTLDANSQRFRENAQKQNDAMNDLANVADALAELGKKTFAVSPEMGKEIGTALRQMTDAMRQMEIRNPSGTSQKQGEAMGSLNRASMLMENALGNMMQGGQGGMGMGGLMSRLQQAAGTQGGINAGTQQAMQLGQGSQGQLTPQQQAEYQRLGTAQGALQKSMEELAREAKNHGDASRLLGDLEKIATDMKEIQSNLEQGEVNPNTLQRQEKILSRLLESTKSMRERDYENKRRAEGGNNVVRTTPAEIDLSTQEGKDRLKEELQKLRDGRYTKDYEELIRKYFEQLEKEEIDN